VIDHWKLAMWIAGMLLFGPSMIVGFLLMIAAFKDWKQGRELTQLEKLFSLEDCREAEILLPSPLNYQPSLKTRKE